VITACDWCGDTDDDPIKPCDDDYTRPTGGRP
jgi:hypothetical protein